MKLTSLQRCFCASLFLHSTVVGVAAVAGFSLHRAALQHDDEPMTLTLIAAPLTAADPVAREAKAMVPAARQPLPIKPMEIAPVEPVISVAPVAEPLLPATPQTQPTVPTPAPVDVASIAPSTSRPGVRGDGSSARPGLDATTLVGQPGVKAKPNYLKNPEPAYPALARRRGQEGLVLLTVKVTADGSAASVALKVSSGFTLLDAAALQAVRDWEFEPARVGSRSVEAEIEVPVRFKLSK